MLLLPLPKQGFPDVQVHGPNSDGAKPVPQAVAPVIAVLVVVPDDQHRDHRRHRLRRAGFAPSLFGAVISELPFAIAAATFA